jgi:hypothetical protein
LIRAGRRRRPRLGGAADAEAAERARQARVGVATIAGFASTISNACTIAGSFAGKTD